MKFNRRLAALLSVSVAWLLPLPAMATSYTYTTFTFPGSASLSGINKQGQVVGTWIDAQDNNHGFLLQNGKVIDIVPPGSTTITGIGINNAGTIVGGYSPAGGRLQGFTYSNGLYTLTSNPAFNVEFYGINNHGESVGKAYKTSGTIPVPKDNHVITMQQGKIRAWKTGYLTQAYAVNDQGTLLGTYLNPKVGRTGFTQRGRVVTPIIVDGHYSTNANGINEAGTVVGSYAPTDLRAASFIDQGGVITTTQYPGLANNNTIFYGVNNLGQIAGLAFGAMSGQHVDIAFIYSNGTFTPLSGVPGVTLTIPSLINDAGEIAGTYYPAAGGGYQAFVATPQ